MKRNIFLTAIFMAMVLLLFSFGKCGSGSKDENASTIVFATDSTWPPFEFIDENKEIVGLTIDLVKAIGKEADFTPEFVSTAWDGIFVGLNNSEYHAIASSVTITEERKQQVDFSDPYYNAGQVLVMNKDAVGTAQSLSDLVGKKVGAQLGTQGAFLVEENKNIELKTYDEIGYAVEELANGTIDGLVADSPLVSQYVLKNEKYGDSFVLVGEPMTKEEYGFVARKGNSEIIEKINQGLATIKENGEYDAIIAKWIE